MLRWTREFTFTFYSLFFLFVWARKFFRRPITKQNKTKQGFHFIFSTSENQKIVASCNRDREKKRERKTSMDVIKTQKISSRPIEKVIVPSLVLLSITGWNFLTHPNKFDWVEKSFKMKTHVYHKFRDHYTNQYDIKN